SGGSSGCSSPTPPSTVEPGVHQAAAHAITVVAAEALHVCGVHDVARPHRQIDVVRLVGQVALDVEHDLPAPRRIELAALYQQHPIHVRIVDAAAIARRGAEERLVDHLV